jgi:hypothetical protein
VQAAVWACGVLILRRRGTALANRREGPGFACFWVAGHSQVLSSPYLPSPPTPLPLRTPRRHAGDARACAALWDESQPTTAPLRSLLAAAARLFPAVPPHLLQLLRLTAASADTARAAYAFLQRSVSLVVLHAAGEPAIRHLGGGEVELTAALPWNLAPSVPGLALPQVGGWGRKQPTSKERLRTSCKTRPESRICFR